MWLAEAIPTLLAATTLGFLLLIGVMWDWYLE